MSSSASHFGKVAYYSLVCTGKIWELDKLFSTEKATYCVTLFHSIKFLQIQSRQSELFWKLHYTAKYKLVFSFFILSSQFLLQYYSCAISTLGGFQDQTGYSPELPGLASQLTLLQEEVGAFLRCLLTWIISQSRDYCFFLVKIRISQGFQLCISLPL